MKVSICDICGGDLDTYGTWVSVPVVMDHPRILRSSNSTILHLQVVKGHEDFDICGSCFRNAMRIYLKDYPGE